MFIATRARLLTVIRQKTIFNFPIGPDLDHSKLAVLSSLGSPGSRRVYEFALDQFIAWYCSEPRLAFNRIVATRYRMYLESRKPAADTINQQLAAVRRLKVIVSGWLLACYFLAVGFFANRLPYNCAIKSYITTS